jgi:protein arginine kinase
MIINKKGKTKMPWYNTVDVESAHVLFTKLTYIRNPILAFGDRADKKEREQVRALLDSILTSNGFSCESFASADKIEPLSLCEKGFVSYSFAACDNDRSAYFNEPCSLAVAIGGRNYVSISAILPGIAAEECRNIASAAEELIDTKLEMAYSESFGYLSPQPCDVGSGTLLSAMLFLPAKFTESTSADRIASSIGAILRPLGKETCLYSLTYTPPLTIAEDSAIALFSAALKKIVAEEKRESGIIFEQSRKIIVEKARRAFGALAYAHEITEKELVTLSRDLRMPFALAAKDELPPFDLKFCNELLALCGNNSLSAVSKFKSDEECDAARAALAQKLISSSGAAPKVADGGNGKGAEKKNGK